MLSVFSVFRTLYFAANVLCLAMYGVFFPESAGALDLHTDRQDAFFYGVYHAYNVATAALLLYGVYVSYIHVCMSTHVRPNVAHFLLFIVYTALGVLLFGGFVVRACCEHVFDTNVVSHARAEAVVFALGVAAICLHTLKKKICGTQHARNDNL